MDPGGETGSRDLQGLSLRPVDWALLRLRPLSEIPIGQIAPHSKGLPLDLLPDGQGRQREISSRLTCGSAGYPKPIRKWERNVCGFEHKAEVSTNLFSTAKRKKLQ